MPSATTAGTFEFTTSTGVPPRMVDQARGDARAVGYAQGWSQGLREAAESQVAQRDRAAVDYAELAAVRLAAQDRAVQALQAAAERLTATEVSITDDICDRILAAAVELAQALLGQELTQPLTSASAALGRILRLAPDREPITVRLAPADHATLSTEAGTELIAALNGNSGRTVTLELDPALATGDALARASSTTIDARLSVAVDRLREYTAVPAPGTAA